MNCSMERASRKKRVSWILSMSIGWAKKAGSAILWVSSTVALVSPLMNGMAANTGIGEKNVRSLESLSMLALVCCSGRDCWIEISRGWMSNFNWMIVSSEHRSSW